MFSMSPSRHSEAAFPMRSAARWSTASGDWPCPRTLSHQLRRSSRLSSASCAAPISSMPSSLWMRPCAWDTRPALNWNPRCRARATHRCAPCSPRPAQGRAPCWRRSPATTWSRPATAPSRRSWWTGSARWTWFSARGLRRSFPGLRRAPMSSPQRPARPCSSRQTATRPDWHSDHLRDQAALARGHTPLRLTSDQVLDRETVRIVSSVTRRLGIHPDVTPGDF